MLLTAVVVGVLLYPTHLAPKVDRYLTDLLQRSLETQFKREVSVGAVHLELPALQLVINDLAIARRQTLAEGTLLAAKTLRADVAATSLLAKYIVIEAIILEQPEIWVEFDEQGRSNLPTFDRKQKQPPEPSRFDWKNLTTRLRFPKIQCVDGQVYFTNQQIPLTVSIGRINTTLALTLGDVQAKGALQLHDGDVTFQDRGTMRIDLDGALAFQDNRLEVSGFHGQVNQSAFTLDGTLTNPARPELDVDVTAQLFLEELEQFLRIEQNLAGLVRFDGTVAGPIPGITARGQLTCAEGAAWKLDFANLSTKATYHGQQVIIADLAADMFEGRVTGDGVLSLAALPRYTASVALHNVNLAEANRLVPRPQPLPLAGRADATVQAQADSFGFADLRLETSIQLRDGDIFAVNIPRAEVQARIADQTLFLNEIRAEVFDGQASGDGRMHLSSTPDYHADLEVRDVALTPIMVLLPNPPDVAGRVSGALTAQGQTFGLDALTLDADLAGRDLQGYQIAAAALESHVQIEKRMLTLSDLSADLFEGRLTGSGTLALAGPQQPRFDIKARLADVSVQSVLRQLAADAETAVTFDGTVAGEVTAAGNSFALPDIRATVALTGAGQANHDAQAETGQLPLDLALQAQLADNRVTVETFEVTSDTLNIATAGAIALGGPELDLTYNVDARDLQTIMPQVLLFVPAIADDSPLYRFAGNIEHLRGTVAGPLSDLTIQADAHCTNADFVWARADDLTAAVRYQNQQLSIEDANAEYQSAALQVSGSLDLRDPGRPVFDLPVTLQAGKLADYLAMVKQPYPIDGQVQTIRTTLQGAPDDLRANLTLDVQQGAAWEQSFDALSAQVGLDGQRITIEALKLRKNGGLISGDAFLNFDTLAVQADLTAADLNFHDIDAVQDVAVQYQGLADITLELGGTIPNPTAKADIRFKELMYGDRPIEDITCDVELKEQTVHARLETFRKKFVASVQLGLSEALDYQAELTMEQAAVEQILSVFAEIEGISGQITGQITSKGSLRDLQQVSAAVKLSELQLDVFGRQLQNTRDIDVVVTPQKLTVTSLEMQGEELGLFAQGFLDFQGNFDLDLDGILDVRPFRPFLPETAGITALAGRVQLICSMRGTFRDPKIEGLAELNGGRLQLQAYPDPLTNLHGKFAFTKEQIKLINLEGKLSKGSFTSSGNLAYQGLQPESFEVEVTGQNIEMHDVVEALTMTISPHVKLSGDLSRQKLAGDVLVQQALYTKDLDLQAMIFDKTRDVTLTIPGTAESPEAAAFTFDLMVKAPENIRIRNKMAELDLKANLRVQGSPAKPQLEGRVEVLEGEVVFGDIQYEIVSGVLDFTDPLRINPEINIQAKTSIDRYDISLGIEGTLEQFSLTMHSEPELSKAEITRLLAAGTGGTNGYNLVTKPLQTLVEGQIEKAIKLDRFTVDVNPLLSDADGEEAAPTVTLGKRLFKDLLLTFTTTVGGSEQAQSVEIEYELSDNISLTARRDEQGEIDTNFTFKFKIK